jgi:hypothetical protein
LIDNLAKAAIVAEICTADGVPLTLFQFILGLFAFNSL